MTDAKPPPMIPLRRRLFLVALAALVPLGAIAGFGRLQLLARRPEGARRAGIELTRALATAVEAELGRSSSVMEAVVSASELQSGDLAACHRRMLRVVQTQPYWRAIVLVEPDGRPVVHSGFSYGAPLP